MTMKADLLDLLAIEWVTPIVALQKVQCLSLAQRISQWRSQGYEFDQRVVHTPKGARVAAYRLRKKVGQA
jgi:hypothetical protein